MDNDLNRQFIKKVQVANKYMNMCLISVTIGEMQITMTVKNTIQNTLDQPHQNDND